MTIISQKSSAKHPNEQAYQRPQWDASPGLRKYFKSFEAFVHEGGIGGFYNRIHTQTMAHEGGARAGASKIADLKNRWNSNHLIQKLYGTFEAFQEANEAAETAATNGRLRS